MLIKRRSFIQIGSLATGTLMVPRFLKAFEKPAMVPAGNKVVVVIQFSGGNDGLNTVIPYRNEVYYSKRPAIGIKKETAVILNEDAGLHPSLIHFRELHDEGSLGILNSVGYPNPDRSHFRSMDIWQSASDSKTIVNTGWLGRYLDAQCNGCDRPTQALEVDDVLSLALKGVNSKGLAFRRPANLYGSSQEKFFRDLAKAHTVQHGEDPVDYLYKTMADTISSADYIFSQSKLHPSRQQYPSTQLGQSLKTIASLIFSDINTRVYYVSLGSFDTHVLQVAQQKRLFTELNDALKAFTSDLKLNNRFNDVLCFTFSEFGRRVSQNASGGTDHGTANNMFFISGALKQKGLLNALPDLTDLQDGDLKHKVDFKAVYATILNKWLGADDQQILGGKFEQMDFI
jgi:uncharacterized protein (DUF1501 family)